MTKLRGCCIEPVVPTHGSQVMTVLDEIKRSRMYDLYTILGYLQANFFFLFLCEQFTVHSGVSFTYHTSLTLNYLAAWFWWISLLMGVVGLYMIAHMHILLYFHPELEDNKKAQ